ncbi:MAG: hypothetical protein A2046_17140 [Bacteroidetes bacterium GWA2_30_7]|nr:MAG: hypothetical protein A2046_17140 [Bacteroidetes bacterium GWA2_30_7]
MCFYYAIAKKKSAKLIKNKIVSEKQLELFVDKELVNGFAHPEMPIISNDITDVISFARWGLIPSWVKSKEEADNIRKYTLNAKSETIFEKPSFIESIKSKRCLVLCSGFYEWQKVKNKKYPYYISLKDDEIFVFAGIWAEWNNPQTNEKIKTYSIITVEANELVSEIHNEKKRMPLILEYETAKNWLNPNLSESEIKSFFKPYNHLEMKAHTIKHFLSKSDKSINNENITAYYHYPELLSELSKTNLGNQGTLFK